jgi:hypothetical protein
MKLKLHLTLVLLTCGAWAFADDFERNVKPILKKHCTKCHGEKGKVKGKVNLLELTQGKHLLAKPKLLEEMLAAVADYDMPPDDDGEMPDDVRAALVKHLGHLREKALDDAEFAATPIRRMNRVQYNNAVVDLLGLTRDVFQLNEKLMRRYSNHFDPAKKQMPQQVKVASRPLSKDIDGRRPEGFRGVAAFPQDLRAEHGYDTQADHLTLSPLLMEAFLSLSQTIVNSPDLNARECTTWNRYFAPPGQEVTAVKGRYEGEDGPMRVVNQPEGRVWTQDMKPWRRTDWSGGKHLMWMPKRAGIELVLSFTVTEPGSGLKLAFTKASDYGIFDVYLDGKELVKGVDLYDPKVIRAKEITVPDVAVSKGEHTLTFKCAGKNKVSRGFFFAIDYAELIGVEAAKKDVPKTDVAAMETRTEDLLRRAYRRPVDPETLARFSAFGKAKLESGTNFTDTMRAIVSAVLASPEFLYFYTDGGKAKGVQKITDFELAERIALFIWGSIPDDRLLDLAGQGTLSEPAVLGGQIERMLNDKKSQRFVDSFPGQWLQLDRLIASIPDKKTFPHFYYNTGYRASMHMMMEPLLLFETVYLEDRSIVELLNPDFTWRSKELDVAYKAEGRGGEVKVMDFTRRPLKDPRWGGVITNAAVMTMTSASSRTQPITRGAWVNTVIFNNPPDPPPADVPPLPKADEAALAKLTLRERFETHRERADCAACHNQIDPLGFALENYDPTGVWRDKYPNGRDVDASGLLFSKKGFTTAVEFKKVLLAEKPRFVRGFAAHLMAYGLGRHLNPADSRGLDQIVTTALAGDDSMRSMIKMVATSESFQYKNVK